MNLNSGIGICGGVIVSIYIIYGFPPFNQVSKSKPDPHNAEYICSQLGVKCSEAIMVRTTLIVMNTTNSSCRLATPQRTQSWDRRRILGWPSGSSLGWEPIGTLLMRTSSCRWFSKAVGFTSKIQGMDTDFTTLFMVSQLKWQMCFNEKDKDNGAILIQDVTSVIDLISPLESHEEGDHHSVTVTTRWEIKS